MRLAKIRKMDISNGPKTRVSVFVQGCKHHCKNCFNPETWDFNGGKEWTEEINDVILKLMDEDYITGLSILGGDPFCLYDRPNYVHMKDDLLLELLRNVKDKYPEKTIWVWTGYLWEDIAPYECMEKTVYLPLMLSAKRLLSYIDVLVDGPFVEELKDPRLKYSGSSNQRIINVQRSLKAKKVIPYVEDTL